MSSVALATGGVTIRDLENSLHKAVTEVTSTMLNYQSVIVPCDESVLVPGVSAIVGFGGKVSGALTLHISPEGACTLASGLLGMEFREVDEIVADAMGEIVNMLAGGLKKYACQTEEIFKISIPSVIRGNDYCTHVPKDFERRMLGVQAGPCSFVLQLVIDVS
jgi:chemotaxis protein CheX